MGIFRRKHALADEQFAQLRQTAAEWIAPGFRSKVGLAQEMVEYHDDIDMPQDLVLTAAAAAVDEGWRDRLALEKGWQDLGDYARLERAFNNLAGQDVLCRMDFTCCGTCGTAEIDEERTARVEVAQGEYGFEEWAYTFFHRQDSERLIGPDAVLFLAYGAFRPAPGLDPSVVAKARAGDEDARKEVVTSTDTQVGELVRDALAAEGLAVTWSGSSAQRISVRVPDWRKPVPRN